MKSRALCRADYALLIRKGSTSISVTRRKKEIDTETHKACVSCSELKERSEFYRSAKSKDGFRADCIPCMKAKNKQSYFRNHEANLNRARERESHPQRKAYVAKCLKAYTPANRDKAAKRAAERRALLRSAMVDRSITMDGLRARLGDCCTYCGVTLLFGSENRRKYDPRMASMEHVLPLSRGGSHSWGNVKLACLRCNHSKNNKTEPEWQEFLKAV